MLADRRQVFAHTDHNPALLLKEARLASVFLNAIRQFVKSVAVKLDNYVPSRTHHVALQYPTRCFVEDLVIRVDRYARGEQFMSKTYLLNACSP
jgi:hypothetical protein